MICIRHQTASGSLDEHWSFDAATCVLHASLRRGSATYACSVRVCSAANPVFGACPVIRVSGEVWRILPSRYVRVWPHGSEALVAIACPITSEFVPGEALTLTNAPSEVSTLLEAL